MSVEAHPLITAQYAPSTVQTLYPVPSTKRVIIDKFSVTNTDSNTRTVSVHLVPAGGSVGGSNLIASAKSVSAGESVDLAELKNQILGPGEQVAVVASVADKVVVRMSGRVLE